MITVGVVTRDHAAFERWKEQHGFLVESPDIKIDEGLLQDREVHYPKECNVCKPKEVKE